MGSSQIITNYESLSAITGRMRDAAVQVEWDTLVVLEQQCSQHVAAMKPSDTESVLDEATKQRKIQLINKILADNAVIRHRTELWMAQLQCTIKNNHQEQQLLQAYCGT